jgi:tetratricopeptide (TPR) repeat protein
MVELEKILSERSDDRILRSLKELAGREFQRIVDATLERLQLKVIRSHPREDLVLSECTHTPDGKRFVVSFSRRDEDVKKADVESLLDLMKRVEMPNGLLLSTSKVEESAASLAESNGIGLADGAKLAALLRRFDLDGEVIRSAELWKERLKAAAIPGADRQLEESLRRGYEALSVRDYMKALDHFDHAIMLKEDYDLPWRLKGNTLDEMGYHEQALACYKRALELFPESDETWFSLGTCLFSLGRYVEEVACYDRALKFNPVMQKALINKGSTLHRLGKYQEALETYDKVLKINYRLEKVHNNRGATLHSLGRHNDALAAYGRAIDLRRDYYEAWMNKGNLLFELGRYDEALECFSTVTQLRSELPKGWYLRGATARKIGNVSLAKASLEQAIRLDPEHSEAKKLLEEVSSKIAERYTEVPQIVEDILTPGASAEKVPSVGLSLLVGTRGDTIARVGEETVEELADELYGNRAELLLLLGRLDEAFEDLGRSLRLDPEDARLLTSAGNVLYGLGKLEAAARTYENALTIDPKYAPALFNLQTIAHQLGDVALSSRVTRSLQSDTSSWLAGAAASIDSFVRGDIKGAMDKVDGALALEGLSALQNFKGLLQILDGNLDGAIDTFEALKEASVDPSEAHNNSGMARLKKGDFEGASSEFDMAIKIQRNNHAAWCNRGAVLYKLDRLREAIACFEESLVMLPSTVAATNKGFAHLAADQLDAALKSFSQSLRILETPEAYNNRGLAFERMKKHEEALVSFNEAIRMDPAFKDAQDNARRVTATWRVRSAKAEPPAAATPGEEVFGYKRRADRMLAEINEDYLRGKKKSEIEAIAQSLGVDSSGTRADIILRIMRMKELSKKK